MEHAVPPLRSQFRRWLLSYLHAKGKSTWSDSVTRVPLPQQKDVPFPRDRAQLVLAPSVDWGGHHLETSVSKIFLFYQKVCKQFSQWDQKPLDSFQELRTWIHLGIAHKSSAQTQLSKNLNRAPNIMGLRSTQRGSQCIPFSIIYFQHILNPAFILCSYDKTEQATAVKRKHLCHSCLKMCTGYLQTNEQLNKILTNKYC